MYPQDSCHIPEMNIAVVLLSNLEALVKFVSCLSSVLYKKGKTEPPYATGAALKGQKTKIIIIIIEKHFFPHQRSARESLTASSCYFSLISFSPEQFFVVSIFCDHGILKSIGHFFIECPSTGLWL